MSYDPLNNSYAIDILDDYNTNDLKECQTYDLISTCDERNELLDKFNCITFGSEVTVETNYKPFSYKKLLSAFIEDEIFSIYYFSCHHKIPVDKAIKYKLLCHYCGKKLPIFGINVCSIYCKPRTGGKCAFGDYCKLCTGKSLLIATKESERKARKLAELIQEEKQKDLEMFL